MAENIAFSIAAKITEYTVKPIGQWLCYSCHYNSNIENLKKQKEKLQDARERVQHSVDAALRNEEEIYPVVSKWLTDVDRITKLATRRLRESEEEAGTRRSIAACLNLKQRHQLSRESKKMVENIAELHNNGNFEIVSHPTLPSEGMDYNNNMENLKNQKEKLQHARERVQHSVDAASRNGEKIYSDVSKWLIDVDRITELATKKLREIEEEAGTGSSNAACLNLKQRHQLSREAKKMVENIAQLFAELHNNGNFEKVSNPALPSEEMDYNSNMENLKNQKEKLQHARERVQHSVDAAFKNGEKIYSDVSKWLIDVDRITELATKRLRESEEEAGTGSSNAACQNSEHRHQLSREAKKMVGDIAELFAELHKNGNFEKVSYRIPPSEGMVMTTTDMDYMAMESRMTAVKGIMEALGNADIDKIGVWGMPGVGKSTLMKEIARKAREEKLFNEVVMTVVTNSPDVRRIQGEIADMLGLKFEQETDEGRASRLQRRLSKDEKILVILDDIWKAFDLHKIGIPSEGCKVVMTSRDRDVLISGMGTQKAIHELKILREEEAWNLFEKMAGDSFKDRPQVRGIATKIVEKCGGLPIALVTVSKALRNKSLGIWQDALVQLTRPTPEHDTKIWSPIYSCIQLSYEHLNGGKAVKLLFLLCAQQGYYISYQELLRYGFSMGLFLNIYTFEEARNRLERLVRDLLDSCLLLQSPHSSKEFYMHDLVRDVATIIASSKNHNMFVMRDDGGQKAWPDVEALNRCEALSIHGGDINKHPNKMECPKLRFFHVDCEDSRNLKISDIFFQGMDKLEVLSLRRMRLSSLFPFTNLQTLSLDRCELGDVHGIGELKTLVILSLAHSDISNLPREIGSLTCLRLLDLSNCFELRVIPPNVLSSLVNLEELYMQKTEVQWEVEGPSNEGKNASLAELKRLSHLTTLKIDIRNANNLSATLFPEKLERYKICIGDKIWDPVFMRKTAFSRVLKLNLNMSFQLDLGIKMLLKRTEYLSLDEANSTKSVLYELHREDFQQLKYFHIQNNGNIKHIPVLRTPDVAFPILETFVLRDMFSLEEICPGKLPLSSFKNLKVLVVVDCEKLRFIFSSSIARGLSLLEELNITRCDNLGAIFVKEEDGIEDQGDMMLFGRLQTLVLKDLPMLVGFLSTKDSFMADCRETNSEGNHDLQLPLLHNDQVSFPSLQTLCMEGLPKIKYVWSCDQEPKTVFRGLEQLKILEISNCGVEEIVAVEGGGEALAIRTLVFPRVSILKFINLKRLKWFCKGMYVSKWPMLKEMTIEGCEKVEIFVSEIVSFGKTVEDQRQSEMSIKQPLFSVDEFSFPSLEILQISNMDSLEIIFGKLEGQNGKEPQDLISPASGTEESGATTHFVSTGKLPLIYLKNLKVLEVENFQKLRFLFSSSIARGLPLEKLKIKGCNNISAIVVTEEKDGIEDGDVILFHQLQTLVLEDLPELNLIVIFLSTKSSFMTDCGQIIAEGNHNLHMPLLPHQGKLSLIYFKNLKVLEVKNYQKLRFLFSSSIARGLSLLEKLKIKGCNNMGAIVVTEEKDGIEDGDVILFHQLQTLVLEDLPELVSFSSTKTDCGQIIAEGNHDLHMPLLHHQGKFPLIYFKNLKVLKVENCQKLRFLFSPSIARGLSLLEKLKIKGCNNMGGIVVTEEKDGIEDGDVILFHQLQTLVLKDLPELVSFSSTKSSFMTDCGQIIAEGNHNLHMPLLHHQVSFPSLQTLHMEGLPKIEHVWSCDREPKTDFRLQNLQEICAKRCESLKSLFPTSVVSCLEQLQVLKIEDCGVEEIVVVERGGEAVARTLVFPRVITLNLINLNRLKLFYKGVHVSKWPMLKEVIVFRCEKVEIFASGVVSFEKTVQDQRQSEMSIKQPIFSVDELSFPSLKKLRIRNMDKLEIIWQGQVTASSFSNIQELEIYWCKKLLHVFQSNLHTTTTLIQNLTRLDISWCSSLETIFGNMEGQNGKEPQVLIAPSSGTEESVAREDGSIARHIEFPILTEMSLVGLPKLKWIFEGVHTNLESWPSLKELSLGECGEQVNKMIWASKFASSSSSQENQLPTCIQQSMFVVVEGTFPNLEILSLDFVGRTICPSRFSDFPDSSSLLTRLPNLLELNVRSSGWEEIFSYELVDREIRLSQLRLNHLPMLIHLWKEDSTQPCPLFHNLEFLSLSQCGKLKNLVPSSVSLHNLTYLLISSCHGLINLLTSSTAKTLAQLRYMSVIDCKRITEIVAMEDGEANVAITFNKLRYLELRGLPNLTHFCSGPYSFGFPSLDEVIVRCCPEMKTFSHGVLSTPKLTAVYNNRNRWNSKQNLHWEDDLNTTTRCLWESNQYDTRLLFRERVENSEEDEDHSETTEEW